MMYRKLATWELNRPDKDEAIELKKLPVVFVLDNVRSALNVGSVFRTADGFGIDKVVLCGITAQPPHRDILKTALGATETVNWLYEMNIDLVIDRLKSESYRIIVIEQTTQSCLLQDFKMQHNEKYAFIFGNEVSGVSETVLEKADICLEIPQSGMKHSLNVAVCAGIIGWECVRQIKD